MVRAGTLPEVAPMAPYKRSRLQKLLRRLESRGVQVMLICGPVVGNVELFPPGLESSGAHGPYVYDSRRFPRLFRSDRRFDRGHLNRRGAREYTREVASDFVSLLEADRD